MLGFIGFGNMASAITKGIIDKKIAKPEDIMVSRRNHDKLQEAKKTFGVVVTTDNKEVAKKADVIILAVKPQMMSDVINEIKDCITEDKLIISIAAGKSIDWIGTQFGKTLKIVRCMPNTPALVGAGCSGICFNKEVTETDKAFTMSVFNSLGLALEVPESQMDVVVGVSGSSPAYVFMFMEAMADAAVVAGMPRQQAYQFVAQAVMGSAKLMLDTGRHPGELKDMVCSPGGTTIEAVKVLEEKGMRAAVMDATLSCIEKSKKL